MLSTSITIGIVSNCAKFGEKILMHYKHVLKINGGGVGVYFQHFTDFTTAPLRIRKNAVSFHKQFEKERRKDEEENERGRDGERRLRAADPKGHFFFLSFFEILSDLNNHQHGQAVPKHLADESQTP